MRQALSVATLAIALVGCGDSPAAEEAETSRQVRVIVVQDVTPSTAENRIPRFTRDHLSQLVDLVEEHGGDLAVGLVADAEYEDRQQVTGQGLARVRIDPPPRDNMRGMNAIQALTRKKKLQDAKKAWEDKASSDLDEFMAKAMKLLATSPPSDSSDVVNALTRLAVFLSEPYADPPAKYALLISDCEHSGVTGAVPALPSDAKIIVVNGMGRLGLLTGEEGVIAFESIAPAIQFIIDEAKE